MTLLKKALGLVWKLDRTHFTEYTKEELNDELKSINYFHTEIDTKFGEIYAVYIYIKNNEISFIFHERNIIKVLD